MMKKLLELGGYVALSMIATPIAVETMPIAFFQNLGGLALWYGVAFVLMALAGWGVTDEDVEAAKKERDAGFWWGKKDDDK